MGANLNPAAYFAGVIFCSFSGWPGEIWTWGDNYFWTALFAPMVGAFVGCIALKLYFITIFHHPIYWLQEIQVSFTTMLNGMNIRWGKLKIKQYRAPTKQERRESDLNSPLNAKK